MLDENFFERKSEEVARDLIGRSLVRELDKTYDSEIVETGAYEGEATRSGEGIYYAPGKIYIFKGMGGYNTLAIGTEEEGKASVVTIRKVLEGTARKGGRKLIDGPGKLTREYDITKELDGKSIPNSELWIGGDPADEDLIKKVRDEERMSQNCLAYFKLKI